MVQVLLRGWAVSNARRNGFDSKVRVSLMGPGPASSARHDVTGTECRRKPLTVRVTGRVLWDFYETANEPKSGHVVIWGVRLPEDRLRHVMRAGLFRDGAGACFVVRIF